MDNVNAEALKETTPATTPVKTDKMPPGIPYIVGNEAAERFSYYGMTSILVIFLNRYMMNPHGQPDHLTETEANEWFHTFGTFVYGLPLLGAFLADAVLGKFWVILSLSILYCFGHFALAINDTRVGMFIGCSLIALGAGGIKPCVSANVGDQFSEANKHLLPKVFSWFYFSINIGSAVSTLLIPYLLDRCGPRVAFGVPGIAMLIATIVFWLGREKFVTIRPPGTNKPIAELLQFKNLMALRKQYFRQILQPEHRKALGNILILVPFAAMFWALWNQNFSSWVFQADKLDRHMFGREWLPAQIQTVNPLFVLCMLPLTSYGLYPALGKVVRLTPLRRFGMGLFMVIFAFLVVAWIQTRLDAHERPHVVWQIGAFVLLTLGEVMVSVTHLEFAYTQAPNTMKSLVMCTYLGAIALGNLFTARVNHFIQNPDGSSKLEGAAYFFFFVKVMLVTAILWLVVSPFYRGKTYIQERTKAAT